MNLSKEDRLRLHSEFLLKDLIVGDTMRINRYSDFCLINDKLYIMDSAGHKKKNKWRAEVLIEKVPGNKVILTINPRSDFKDSLSDLIILPYGGAECKEFKSLQDNFNTLEVETINGYFKESDYINSLINKGYKKESEID